MESVVAEAKRSRESYTEETVAAFEDAWQKGMKSLKDKDQIKALSSKLGLPVEKIEVWIGNRRSKDRRGGEAPAYNKNKVSVRGPSSYTLFSQQFKRESSSKEDHFKNVAKKWNELPKETKKKFEEDAKAIRCSELKGMSEEEATAFHLKQIENSVNVIKSLGYEVVMVAMKENSNPQLFGTPKGLEYLAQPPVLESFKKAMFGNTVYINPPAAKKQKGDLRAEVRQVLNSCWEQATNESKPLPYAAVLNGKLDWYIEGLPVPFKEPSNYGVRDLKKILEKKADIKFVKKQPRSTTNGSAEEVVQSIVSNELMLETVHDLSNDDDNQQRSGLSNQSQTEVLDSKKLVKGRKERSPSPEIPLDLVDDMSELLGVKNDNESSVISINVKEDKKVLKRIRAVKGDTKEKKGPLLKKKKSSSVKKDSTKYEIEYLVADRSSERGQEFLVQWKGFPTNDQTWEPVSSLPAAALSCYWENKFKGLSSSNM